MGSQAGLGAGSWLRVPVLSAELAERAIGRKSALGYSFDMPDQRYSRPLQYKLDGHRVTLCESASEWAEWFAVADRRVAQTWLGDVRVSTVFLGLEHNPLPDGSPALFETEVHVNGTANPVRRYAVWDDAEAGHAEIVAMIEAEIAKTDGSLDGSAGIAWDRVSKRLMGN